MRLTRKRSRRRWYLRVISARGMAELLLHIALVDLGRGGEAGAQRMAGKQLSALALRQIAAHAGGQRGALDEPGDLLVVEPIGADCLALPGHPAEQRAVRDAAELQPGLQRHDRAGGVGRAAADLDLAPAGLAAQGHQHALVEDFDPAGTVFGLVAADIETDDLGTAQAAGKAEQQHGAVAQAAQRAAVERFQHGDQILGQHRFLLPGRGGVRVADAGHDGGDMAVLPVERLAALGIIPGQRRKPALDRRHGVWLLVAGRLAGGAGGDVEADDLRIGRQTSRRPAGGTSWQNASSRRRRRAACWPSSPPRHSRGRDRRAASRCAGRRGFATAGRGGEGASVRAGGSSGARPISMTTSMMSGRSSAIGASGSADDRAAVETSSAGRVLWDGPEGRIEVIFGLLLDVLGHSLYKEQNER